MSRNNAGISAPVIAVHEPPAADVRINGALGKKTIVRSRFHVPTPDGSTLEDARIRPWITVFLNRHRGANITRVRTPSIRESPR